MDLSPRIRVYIQVGCWVSHLLRFWPVWSGNSLQIPVERSLDLSWLMCWLSYVGYQFDMWCFSHLLGSAICLNLWKDSWGPGDCCLSPMYTSNMRFSKSRLLAIFGSPWPMTLTPTNEAISHETSWKKTLLVKAKIDRLDGMSCNRCKDRFLSKSVRLLRVGDW